MSRTHHPARRARRIVALASGASYLGLTGSIAVATNLSSEADEVAVDVPTTVPDPDSLALDLDGAAAPVSSTTIAGSSTTSFDLFGDPGAAVPATDPFSSSSIAPEATAPPTTPGSPTTSAPTTAAPTTPSSAAATTAAPTTAAPTTAAPTTAPTTAPPTTAGETTTTAQQTTTTQATTTTTQATTTTTQATTTTTQATTTTTSGAS